MLPRAKIAPAIPPPTGIFDKLIWGRNGTCSIIHLLHRSYHIFAHAGGRLAQVIEGGLYHAPPTARARRLLGRLLRPHLRDFQCGPEDRLGAQSRDGSQQHLRHVPSDQRSDQHGRSYAALRVFRQRQRKWQRLWLGNVRSGSAACPGVAHGRIPNGIRDVEREKDVLVHLGSHAVAGLVADRIAGTLGSDVR